MDKMVINSSTLASYNNYNKDNTRMPARRNYNKKHKKRKKFSFHVAYCYMKGVFLC